MDLIETAFKLGLTVEGLSFHVGSQCTNPENFIQAIHLCHGIFAEAKSRGFNLKLLDIGGGLLAVPQFTLAADTRSGTRPSFTPAAPPDVARKLFDYTVGKARNAHPLQARHQYQIAAGNRDIG